MLTGYRRRHPLAYRPVRNDLVADARFPRAVAGEEYDRYARAVWRQAERWFAKQERRAAPDLTLHEARDIFWSVAAIELGRRLYPQEERLLSELVQQNWPKTSGRVTPEIPTFLVAP